ncbi:MAG: phospholipase D-like domain-containing protein [Rubricoccaceae bacterium]
MSTRALALAVLALVLGAAPAAGQDLIHYWSFNSPAASGPAWPQPVAADVGAGTITYTFLESAVVSFAGSTIGAREGAAAGGSFVVQGGPGTANNGRSFQLNVSTQGYRDLRLSYATRGTAAGFNSQRAEFSTDGGATWTLIGEETGSRGTAFYLVSYDLSGFPALNDAPNVTIRVTLSGATGDTGNNRIDNVALEGTATGGAGTGTGTGTIALEPALVEGGRTHALAFTVTARSDEAPDALSHVDLTLPDGFGPVAAADVVTSPAGGTVVVEGQTVRVSGLQATQSAPATITLQNVAVPDQTGEFGFAVRTGSGTDQTVVTASQPLLRVWGTPEPIADVKVNNAQGVAARLGEWVTVRGVVTVSNQFQTGGGEFGPSSVQDATGGLAVFAPAGVTAQVALGEEVTLFGRVAQFFGLNQLDDQTVVVARHGVPGVPEPLTVTLAQLAADGAGGVEVYEGRLVRVEGVTVNTTVWNAEGAGTNYQLSDGTATLDVRVNRAVDFRGQAAPSGAFALTGVVSQFRNAPPFIGGYQLMPRFAADIEDVSDAPAILPTAPFETAATPTSVTLTWATDRPAHTEVRYVHTRTGAAGQVVLEGARTAHTVTLSALEPATVYRLELRSAVGTDTTVIAGYPVATAAAPGTTHAILPVFNGSVDQTLSTGIPAVQRALVPAFVERIEAATASIDVALYSLSGQAGAAIASALIAAHNRGVRVRVIMDDETAGTAPPTSLRNAGVPFITDDFGSNRGADGLHHNKFAVFDYLGADPARMWVLTGSWNPTDPGSNQHFQNVVFFQDGAVAAAFTAEFDQMWGSQTATPDPAAARFHAAKTLVAPTALWVGETYVRLFFSPQGFGNYGSTEQQINAALAEAEHEIALGLNLITRMPIVDVLRARHEAGVLVRGVVGDPSPQGSVFNDLAAFADVLAFPSAQLGLLHHKYALVDPAHPQAGPVTITGSHNWSRAANESNNENTVLIHSPAVANQFLQEFAARYRQAGGQGSFPTRAEPVSDEAPLRFAVSANAPNPFSAGTHFEYRLPTAATVTVRVFNTLGQEVRRVVDAEAQAPGVYRVDLSGDGLAAGVYLYRVEAQTDGQLLSETRRMLLVR